MPYANPLDQKAYAKKHYAENKADYLRRARSSRQSMIERNRDYINDLKSFTPCIDCGNVYPPECMDFDHISNDKVANVARLSNLGLSIQSLMTEIAKCELVCSNCHRIRTKARLVQRKTQGS
jgi:hypothetical protein